MVPDTMNALAWPAVRGTGHRQHGRDYGMVPTFTRPRQKMRHGRLCAAPTSSPSKAVSAV